MTLTKCSKNLFLFVTAALAAVSVHTRLHANGNTSPIVYTMQGELLATPARPGVTGRNEVPGRTRPEKLDIPLPQPTKRYKH